MFKNLFSKNKGKEEEIKEEAKVEVKEEAKVETPAPAQETRELVDMDIALANCGDMEDMLKEMFGVFAESKDEKRTEMENEYKAQDWENYRIHVHALKSTSLTVGCVPLNELAKDVELAAKEIVEGADEARKAELVAHINEHHDELMKLYDDTVAVVIKKADEIEVDE